MDNSRKRLASTRAGAASKKQKKEDAEDFSVFGTLDTSFLEKDEGPISWSSGAEKGKEKEKKTPKRKTTSPKKTRKAPPKTKSSSLPESKAKSNASPPSPSPSANNTVWEIQEQGNTIEIEDKLSDLMKGMDPTLFHGEALRGGVIDFVKYLVVEPRSLPVLGASSSHLTSLKKTFLEQGAEEGEGLAFWRVSLLVLIFRESFVTHSFFSIELLDFVFSLLNYGDSTFSASSVLELSDSQSQSSSQGDPGDSESDEEGLIFSQSTTYSKPKKEEQIETPAKTQDQVTVMKRRQLTNEILKGYLAEGTEGPFPQTFSVVVLLELILGGCVIRRYLRTMEFIRFLSKEISACLSYLKAFSAKKEPLRIQKSKKEFQIQILRTESILQLIEELSLWGGMEKQLTESGLAGKIVHLIGMLMNFFQPSSPNKPKGRLVRSTSDPTKPNSKKASTMKHSASSFAGLPPPEGQDKWKLLVDETYMCDCLLGCEKTIVNLTNHNRLSSEAVGDKECLERVCSVLLLMMSEQKKVDAHLMAIAIVLNVFESYPEARVTFRSVKVKATPALTFFSRLFLENLPSQVGEFGEKRKTTTTSRIVPAYVLMLLAMACLDNPKNSRETLKIFQKAKEGLRDLLQDTIQQVTKIFGGEGDPNERDTLLANLVSQLTQKLAFNW